MKELTTLAKSLGVRLAVCTRKADIVERLLAMAKIGAVRDMTLQQEKSLLESAIYITAEVRDALQQLPCTI